MAEELYFIKLNEDVAKTKLVQFLNTDNLFTYKEYTNKYVNDDVNYEKVIEKIETSIEKLSSEEFWSLFLWLTQRAEILNPNSDYIESQIYFKKSMVTFGMDLFYEIPSKTPVRKFHSILGDYEFLTDKELDFKCEFEELDNFLKYAICFSGKLLLFLQQNYYDGDIDVNDNIQQKIEEIILKYDKQYYYLASKQFKDTYNYNLETIHLLSPIKEFRKKLKTHLTSPIQLSTTKF